MNTRIRAFLTVVSLLFAALLVLEIGRSLLRTTDRQASGVDTHRVVDRPADPAPAANPPRTPGRSLIRNTAQFAAKAG
ncbi:MAG: hypothetical protein J0J01_05040 [Reyranella sp.]|uniref:hypothetical protein n=1 Tax=Reyranella sp. TaxID=1929291 RepID=UPI001AC410C8|nr:hypothetical protein [Reyranella sp.]MBN9086250.1 hypothetical protein [Reyranella sp.]